MFSPENFSGLKYVGADYIELIIFNGSNFWFLNINIKIYKGRTFFLQQVEMKAPNVWKQNDSLNWSSMSSFFSLKKQQNK